jgi:hypothetical protein
MRIPAENYKGIEFVRISNMPVDERERIFKTISREKIIKILRDKELLNDCVQVTDYQEWLNNSVREAEKQEVQEVKEVLRQEALKLAFK